MAIPVIDFSNGEESPTLWLRLLMHVKNGDSFRYKSTWHRVLPTGKGNRRSIASFYNPSLKATIAPAPQLAKKSSSEEVNQLYLKFGFGDYMSVYVEQKFLPEEPRFQAVRAV